MLQLRNLPFSDKRRSVDPGQSLGHPVGHTGPGGLREQLELVQFLRLIPNRMVVGNNTNQNGRFKRLCRSSCTQGLLDSYCLLPIAYWLLLLAIGYCLLPIAHCSPSAAFRPVFGRNN